MELCKIMEFNKKGMVKNKNSDLLGGVDYRDFLFFRVLLCLCNFYFLSGEKNFLRFFFRGFFFFWNGCFYGI